MFTLSPDRLKHIVERFVKVLEVGLEKDKQTVVSCVSKPAASRWLKLSCESVAHATRLCLWLALG